MTRNTLEYLKNKETAQHNRATENQAYLDYTNSVNELSEKVRHNKMTEKQAKAELAETISNNLRNYNINLDKNYITRLANEQLDTRERQKISETVRADIAKELETNRNNLTNSEITRVNSYLDKMIKLMENESKFNVLKVDLSGLMAALFDTLNGTSGQFGEVLTAGSNIQGSTFGGGQNLYNYSTLTPKKYDQTQLDSEYNAKRTQTSNSNYSNRSYSSNSKRDNRKLEENEIPEDYSNSSGPSSSKGGNSNESSTKTQQVAWQNPNSGGNSSSSSSSSQSGSGKSSSGKSSVIYSPGSQSSSIGPGQFIS